MAQNPQRPRQLLPEPICRECGRRGIRAKATAPGPRGKAGGGGGVKTALAEPGRGSANVQLGFQCVL